MGGGRVRFFLLLLLFTPFTSQALEELSEEKRKEAFSFGKESGELFRDQSWDALKSLFGQEDTLIKTVSKEPILDAKEAKRRCDSQNFPPEQELSKQVKKALVISPKLDVTPLSQETKEVSEHPESELGTFPHEVSNSSEMHTETCMEKTANVQTILQERKVTVTPKKTSTVYYCRGHTSKEHSKWKLDSIERIKREWNAKRGIEVTGFKEWKEWGHFKLKVNYKTQSKSTQAM